MAGAVGVAFGLLDWHSWKWLVLQGKVAVMRLIRDPRQTRMFDPFEGVLSGMARDRILSGWQGLFRLNLPTSLVHCDESSDGE